MTHSGSDLREHLRLLGVAAYSASRPDGRPSLAADRTALAFVQAGPIPSLVPTSEPQPELPTLERDRQQCGIKLSDDAFVQVPSRRNGLPRAWVGPLLRELVSCGVTDDSPPVEVDLGGGFRLAAQGTAGTLATDRVARGRRWEAYAERDFANSAHYMGTKRQLVPMIMGAVDLWSVPTGALVDLMTGSGVVAGAFAQVGPTWASDAQAFSLYLARAQGGGQTRRSARELLAWLRPRVRDHQQALGDLLGPWLSAEDAIFAQTSDLSDLMREYTRLVREFPTYPASGADGWDPVAEVEGCRAGTGSPDCLMTAYYANVFFGLRQAIDLDAVRHALKQVDDSETGSFALGALVATASDVGTTYGGHFAQPYATESRLERTQVLRRTLEFRSRSVLAEFEARLLALASQSEAAANPVRVVPGAWQRALHELSAVVDLRDATVYLDPPYTRDEYSRYYHVLETLVRYDYPHVAGPAKMPTKGISRFRSEFHTRTAATRVERLQQVLAEVLSTGATCLWSHSSGLDVQVEAIVDPLPTREVMSVGCLHSFKQQGAARGRIEDHQEQLVLLRPR